MSTEHSLGAWSWKAPICGLVHALGTLLGLMFVEALGLTMPRPIEGTDPESQTLLLAPAGMAIAAGFWVRVRPAEPGHGTRQRR